MADNPEIRKNHGYQTTATERMAAARRVKDEALAREMCWAAIGSRIWPAYVMPPRIHQDNYPLVCVMVTPAGRIAYRVREDEVDLFAHLERRPNDGTVSENKVAVLMALAMDGWNR